MTEMRRTLRSEERGQSLVEFALVLPVLIFLLLAIIEGGRIFCLCRAQSGGMARFASINCTSEMVSDHQIPAGYRQPDALGFGKDGCWTKGPQLSLHETAKGGVGGSHSDWCWR